MPPIPIRVLPTRIIKDPTPDIEETKSITPDEKPILITEDLYEPEYSEIIEHTKDIETLPQPPSNSRIAFLLPVVCVVGGIVVLWFGIFNAGSFYAQGTRFSGQLATIFYTWQIGNILEVIGCIAVYHGLTKGYEALKNVRR